MTASSPRAGPGRLPTGRILLFALALLCAAAPPAAAQRRATIAQRFRTFMAQLRVAVEHDPPAAERPPAGLKPCGTLYGPEAIRIAQALDYAWSHSAWLRQSFDTIEEYGGLPLPLCFDYRSDTLTTSQGWRLLQVNSRFILERSRGGFVLTGHTDPVENDTLLARTRAEWIQGQTPWPTCHVARWRTGQVATMYHRKVYYSPQAGVRDCRRSAR